VSTVPEHVKHFVLHSSHTLETNTDISAGHDDTHVPEYKSIPDEQVMQLLTVPEQVAHGLTQAKHIPVVGIYVPEGHESTHPLLYKYFGVWHERQ
jgi:hypothetical protein